ncbi:MAG: thioredoxin [Moorea sp. SIO2B7]|nr:thioredoxin [Moorena sp. SIO2B7]
MSNVKVITDTEFETEVLNSEKPVLAYFWDRWCGPCRLVSPSIDSVSEDEKYSDRLKVVKLQVDSNPDAVAKYNVEGVPALRLFKNKELIVSHEGAITKDKLKTMLDEHLN